MSEADERLLAELRGLANASKYTSERNILTRAVDRIERAVVVQDALHENARVDFGELGPGYGLEG